MLARVDRDVEVSHLYLFDIVPRADAHLNWLGNGLICVLSNLLRCDLDGAENRISFQAVECDSRSWTC
jgi:hypothetical protein